MRVSSPQEWLLQFLTGVISSLHGCVDLCCFKILIVLACRCCNKEHASGALAERRLVQPTAWEAESVYYHTFNVQSCVDGQLGWLHVLTLRVELQ